VCHGEGCRVKLICDEGRGTRGGPLDVRPLRAFSRVENGRTIKFSVKFKDAYRGEGPDVTRALRASQARFAAGRTPTGIIRTRFPEFEGHFPPKRGSRTRGGDQDDTLGLLLVI
jgi:hypothetical protein